MYSKIYKTQLPHLKDNKEKSVVHLSVWEKKNKENVTSMNWRALCFDPP